MGYVAHRGGVTDLLTEPIGHHAGLDAELCLSMMPCMATVCKWGVEGAAGIAGARGTGVDHGHGRQRGTRLFRRGAG